MNPGSGSAKFQRRSILILVLVGIMAFAGLSVLAAYAPDLRGGMDGGAHALSSSAVGFKGATVMAKALELPVAISRVPPNNSRDGKTDDLLVLTPTPDTSVDELAAFPKEQGTLIVLPKWRTAPDPLRPSYVRKAGLLVDSAWAEGVLAQYAKTDRLAVRDGVTRPVLHGGAGVFAPATYLPLGPIDHLQTLSGEGWVPALVDETGRMVLAYAKERPEVVVLADPDLLNNQGLAQLDTARAGMAILQVLNGEGAVRFDVTLNGFAKRRSIGRLMLEPPWLAATLCAVAAAVLMGWQALVRFGPAREQGRAVALGASALVDNSAGLVRMARKEAALAPQYVELSKALVVRAAGASTADADSEAWLAEHARRKGLASPDALGAEAVRTTSREDLLELGRKLFRWRQEMTRERG